MTGANGGMPARMVGNTRWSIPYDWTALFRQRIRRHLVEPRCQGRRRLLGLWRHARAIWTNSTTALRRLCAILLDDVNMFGYCYTQLTDIYQEQNGIYKFDRGLKFDMDRIRAAQIKPAAIELADK